MNRMTGPSNLLAHVMAEQAFGLEQQHHQENDVGRDVLPSLREIEAGHALDHADQDAADESTWDRAETTEDGCRKRL